MVAVLTTTKKTVSATKTKGLQGSATPPTRGAFVQSLSRGIAVLEIVASSTRNLTCREIAEIAGLDRTITHRILCTLKADGLVDVESGRYSLGGRNLLFGNAYLDHLNLRRIALPYLLNLLHNRLSGYSLATISLFIAIGPFVTSVEQLWPPTAPLDVVLSVGSKLPIETTAAGRCMLAFAPPEEVEDLIGQEAAAKLAKRFAEIRAANGVDYARDDEPHGLPGMGAVSALIRDRNGETVASLSVSGLGLDSQLDRNSEIAIQLRRAADQIGLAVR